MEEVKISKKSKVGILPFVTNFEEFAELAETIFRNAERRGDLDKAYVKLIRAVFMNGETSGQTKSNSNRLEMVWYLFDAWKQNSENCFIDFS